MGKTWKTTVHDIAKVDLNLSKTPHNTQWFQDYQGVQEPDKVTPVTYSPEMDPDFDMQNSPGGYPNRFCRKPKGEWFSNEGEANHILIDMLKNHEAAIDSLTIDITADYDHAYWIDPNGKVYTVRGASGNESGPNDTHGNWITEHRDMLIKEFGFKPVKDQWGIHLDTQDLINVGWIRVGDGYSADWGITIKDLNNIPSSVDTLLAQFAYDGAKIVLEDNQENYVNFEWPVKSVQQAVNKARLVHASLNKAAITRQYALYIGGRLAIRTLTRAKAVRICKERFPNEFASGNYEIKQEEFKISSLYKQAGSQSASVPDYLCDEWKTEQIMNDTDEEPYINHDQRDYPYGMHDSPENTSTGIGWPKDNQPSVVHLDTLENPAFRNDPFGIGSYNVIWYNSLPLSDGIESMNDE